MEEANEGEKIERRKKKAGTKTALQPPAAVLTVNYNEFKIMSLEKKPKSQENK